MSTTREPELLWDAPGLQARLEALPTAGDDGRAGSLRRPVSVLAVAETGSTNSDLLAIAGSAAVDEGALRGVHVLVAEHQRAGRGRQGRTWVSEPGASLTFSLGLAMRPRHGWGALSLAVGYAVAQTLQPWTLDGRPQSPQVPPQGAGVETGCLLLKWPNDLWWYERPPRTPAERAQGA